MTFHFVDQPFTSGYSLRDFFSEVLASEISDLDIVTAWVKRSGVSAIAPVLRSLRGRGVKMRAIVGISLGGTSRQGLIDLLGHVDELFVYQHPGRTFHPKVYRAAGRTEALTLVGSSNLTAGGAVNNFEAGTLGRLDLKTASERSYHTDVKDYVDRLSLDASAHHVDLAFIDTLVASDRYLLPDESAPLATGDETGTRKNARDPILFHKSAHQLSAYLPPRGAPREQTNGDSPVSAIDSSRNDFVLAAPVVDIDATRPTVERRWFKVLGRIDAQQGRSANWNPSNTATLVEAGHPIDRETYFRDEFFVDLDWRQGFSRGGKQREVAELIAEVIANDESLGDYQFEVRHTPDYNSRQKNRTTELQWGELSSHMRTINHVDDYLTLERLSDGSFRLHLSTQPPGQFKK